VSAARGLTLGQSLVPAAKCAIAASNLLNVQHIHTWKLRTSFSFTAIVRNSVTQILSSNVVATKRMQLQ